MPNNKRPASRKSASRSNAAIPAEEKEEVLSAALCALALEVAEREAYDEPGEDLENAFRQKEHELHRLVRRYLNQQQDDILYTAIELAGHEDIGAYRLLRSAIEEAAATVQLRRDNAPVMEIDAFAIPVFVQSTGGLVEADGFQDDEAYEALLASMKAGGLESPQAKLVLVRHAYDAFEASRITYSHLHAMAQEAAVVLTNKKVAEAPALQRSIAGWSAPAFGADDEAVELRFLVGFSLKRADDPFYAVPADETRADAWFAARLERYRRWSADAAPLVQRCLAPAGRALRLNFLYQDLFFGARAAGLAEQAMLATMATLNAALTGPTGAARAEIVPAHADGEPVLRVQLYGGANLLTTADLPLEPDSDVADAVAELRDALGTLGVTEVAVKA